MTKIFDEKMTDSTKGKTVNFLGANLSKLS